MDVVSVLVLVSPPEPDRIRLVIRRLSPNPVVVVPPTPLGLRHLTGMHGIGTPVIVRQRFLPNNVTLQGWQQDLRPLVGLPQVPQASHSSSPGSPPRPARRSFDCSRRTGSRTPGGVRPGWRA